MKKIKIGINGFGRIGRAFARINLKYNLFDIVVINELDPDINNMAYLLKYDSTYGKLMNDKIDVVDNNLNVNGSDIKVFHKENIDDIPWIESGIDLIIDSSGIKKNVLEAKKLLNKGIKKIVVTHSPNEGTDFTFMYGVNEESYDPSNHKIISSSICDANAVAPFYKLIDDKFGIEAGDITTLHPWLSYQNLLDGNLKSVSSPGHYWRDYALGRSSIGTLIPKDTTLVGALKKVLPQIGENVKAFSFRIPTSIVAAANGVFILKKSASSKDIIDSINEYFQKYPYVLKLDDRSLISIDHLQNENAAVIDQRWLQLTNGKLLRFVLWYDNEWGYTKRIYDLINYLGIK